MNFDFKHTYTRQKNASFPKSYYNNIDDVPKKEEEKDIFTKHQQRSAEIDLRRSAPVLALSVCDLDSI